MKYNAYWYENDELNHKVFDRYDEWYEFMRYEVMYKNINLYTVVRAWFHHFRVAGDDNGPTQHKIKPEEVPKEIRAYHLIVGE